MMTNVNVTVDAIEEQIAKLQNPNRNVNKKTSFDAKDYLDTRLKNGETVRKVKVRILPASVTNGNFFIEYHTHSLKVDKKIAESGFKSFTCLNEEQLPNYDKNIKCPLCSKSFELFKAAKELKTQGRTAEADILFNKAKELQNKTTYIVRVIDRAHEDEGVKFWRFNKSFTGKGILDKLLKLYNNKKESYLEQGKGGYNIFDLEHGRDIIITITRSFDSTGTKELANNIDIDASDFESPLTTDEDTFNKWVFDEKKWYNAYTARTPEYLALIADDKIPVKKDGEWVAWVDESKNKEEEEKIQKESQKILENQIPTQVAYEVKPEVTVNVDSNIDDDDDLPF